MGEDVPVFIGKYSQRGYGFGSILAGLARNIILPTVKTLGKSLVKTAGRSLKRQAIKAATGLAEDVFIKRKNLKKSLGERGRELASDVTQDLLRKQRGRGRKRPATTHPDIFHKRRRITDVFEEED
jgi:hypothetical protein